MRNLTYEEDMIAGFIILVIGAAVFFAPEIYKNLTKKPKLEATIPAGESVVCRMVDIPGRGPNGGRMTKMVCD